MIRHPSGYFEIRENGYSRLTIDLSHGNIDFSYSDADGGHAHFDVDADDLRKVLDELAPVAIESDPRVVALIEAERERCAKICADIAGEVDWPARGIMQMDAEQVGIECACRIRGEK